MTPGLRNPTTAWRLGEWRFGDGPQDLEAWLQRPDLLHIMIDVRAPQTPPDQWHRIMTVTAGWLMERAKESRLGGIWPAILIVPDGTRAEIVASVTKQLDQASSVLLMYADLVPLDYADVDL